MPEPLYQRVFNQSPRYRDGVHPAPHATTDGKWKAGLDALPTTCGHTNASRSSRKGVANGRLRESQTSACVWLATLAIALTFWALFLGSLFAVGAFGKCRAHRCWAKVSHRRHIEYAWRWIKAHPMPYCTWGPESGPGDPWKLSRYRIANESGSDAGGKFQIIYSTWLAYGGKPYGNARFAPPLEQERIARRILARQGLGAWSRC